MYPLFGLVVYINTFNLSVTRRVYGFTSLCVSDLRSGVKQGDRYTGLYSNVDGSL